MFWCFFHLSCFFFPFYPVSYFPSFFTTFCPSFLESPPLTSCFLLYFFLPSLRSFFTFFHHTSFSFLITKLNSFFVSFLPFLSPSLPCLLSTLGAFLPSFSPSFCPFLLLSVLPSLLPICLLSSFQLPSLLTSVLNSFHLPLTLLFHL